MTSRTVQVAFHRALPRDDDHPLNFNPERALDQIDELERESGKAYISRSMFEDLLCTVHGESDVRMLVGWTIDRFSSVFVERKGEVKELDLFEDQGVAEPAYGMFFPDGVLGFIRPASRSPGVQLVGEYIEHFTHASNLSFAPLVDASVLKKLQRPAEDVVRVNMRIRGENVAGIEAVDGDLHSVLQAATGYANSNEVKFAFKVTRKKEKAQWWSRVRPTLMKLVRTGASEEFASLSVTMQDGTIQLLREQITYRVPIPLRPDSTLRPETAVTALLDAYERKQSEIQEALTFDFPE